MSVDADILRLMDIIKNYIHFFQIPEVSRNDEQENDHEDDITSLLIPSPSKCSWMLEIYVYM